MVAQAVDDAVLALSRRQHGVVTRAQVIACGGTDRIIGARVARGLWIPLARGVYALAGHPATWHRALMAAVLSKPGSVVSGRAAAALHRLPGFRPTAPEITMTRGGNQRSAIARVHQSRRRVTTTTIDRIPTTAVARTLVDIAGRTSVDRLAAAADHAVHHGTMSIDDLADAYLDAAAARRPGVARIRTVLEARRHDGYVPPASELERLLYEALDDPRIPGYERQAHFPWRPTAPQRVDALITAWGIIPEADGRRWHTRVEDFERDRRRDNAAAAHGLRVMRFTWVDLRDHRDESIELLVQAGRAGLRTSVQ